MKKALKFLSIGMAIAMCMSMAITPAFAADDGVAAIPYYTCDAPDCPNPRESCPATNSYNGNMYCDDCYAALVSGNTTQEVETGKTPESVEVSVINASTYTVTIPKTLSVTDADTISYNVSVTGDIAGTEKVVVTPDANVVLSSDGKDDVTAAITQDKTEWTYTEWATQGNGTIDVSGTTAGEWNGTFNFNISLETVAASTPDTPEAEEITFTIDGTSYQAEEGMTWREWVESEYNTDSYTAGIYGVHTIDDMYYVQFNEVGVGIGTAIIANFPYTLGSLVVGEAG